MSEINLNIYISVKEAQEICNRVGYPVTEMTIGNWCRDYGIGKKIIQRWFIDEKLLKKLLEGELQKNGKEKKKK